MAESAALLVDEVLPAVPIRQWVLSFPFSLHAGVAAKANERHKLERLCRYISRPAVSEKRLSLTAHGQVRYSLKTPWNDGTTHVIFERGGPPPLDFMAHIAARDYQGTTALLDAFQEAGLSADT